MQTHLLLDSQILIMRKTHAHVQSKDTHKHTNKPSSMSVAAHSVPLHILNVFQDICLGVICPDAHDLPVKLPIINHGICSQGLHLVHSPLLALGGANFNHIYWVIVSLQSQSSKNWISIIRHALACMAH